MLAEFKGKQNMNFKKYIYISLITTSLISFSICAMQSAEVKTVSTEADELWIDHLSKYDQTAAAIITHLAKLHPSLAFCLQLKQSEVENYFKAHPEILETLLKISQNGQLQPNETNSSEEKAK